MISELIHVAEIDGACHVLGRRHMHTGFWWGNMKEWDHSEDLGPRWENNIKMDLQEIGWEGVSR